MPKPELPKPVHMTVYATLAKDESLSGRERCIACEGLFDDDDPILMIRDHRLMIDYILHCRCITKIISAGPIEQQEFEKYREGLLTR